MIAGPQGGERSGAALACLLAFLLAATAQILFFTEAGTSTTARFEWAAGLLAISIVLFALASHRLPTAPADAFGGFGAQIPGAPHGEREPFPRGLAVALALTCANGVYWLALGESPATRWVWLLSVLLLFWPTDPAGLPRPRSNAAPALALAAVLGVAFALRAIDLADLPLALHGDMAEMGLGGRALLQGEVPAFIAVGWASIPWAGYLPAALGLSLADNLTGLRLGAVLLGVAGVAGIYLLGALLFGRRIGIVAAGANAIGFAEIHFSRMPAYGDPVPFLLFGLYFLLRGLRRGDQGSFLLAGALLSGASLLYYSGRVALLLAAAVLVHALCIDSTLWRRRRRGLAIAALAALVCAGPMVGFFAREPEALVSRHRDIWAFTPSVAQHLQSAYDLPSMTHVIAHQAARAALLFHHTSDTSLQGALPWPMLSPLLAPFAAVGFAVCLTRLRSPGAGLLVAWWASLVLGVAVFTSDAPFWPRLVVVLPVAALLIAIGWDRIFDAVKRLRPLRPFPGFVPLATAAALLAVAGARNWSMYRDQASVAVGDADWLGRLLAAEPASRFCMVPGRLSFREEEIRFLAPHQDLLEVTLSDVGSCATDGRVLVVYPDEQPEVLATLRALAPHHREVAHDYPNGLPGPVFRIPP